MVLFIKIPNQFIGVLPAFWRMRRVPRRIDSKQPLDLGESFPKFFTGFGESIAFVSAQIQPMPYKSSEQQEENTC